MADELSPFLKATAEQIIFMDDLVFGLWDQYPVTPGHALVIPKRVVAAWFDAKRDERVALIDGVDRVREAILQRYSPQGFNIGVNVGEVAGQTVPHLHVHVIPRYSGDVPDPTGGIRAVIPDKANYLPPPFDLIDGGINSNANLVVGGEDHLLQHLRQDFDQAERVDMAVAFVMRSGIEALYESCRDVILKSGATEQEPVIRLLTGDYLDATDPDGLRRCLDLGDRLELYVYETDGQSFHPKSYLFHHASGSGVAYVGSSNLSLTALTNGIEWNYRVIGHGDREAFLRVSNAFEQLLIAPNVKRVTDDWIEEYSNRRTSLKATVEAVRPPDEPAPVIPDPHVLQQAALKALRESRDEGNRAGLVVLATGLGKTWLAAFDSKDFRRILFVAHREEILQQALSTFRRIRPKARLGFYKGSDKAPDADVLFASIQTLSRQTHLNRFDPKQFDYVVVDEFHHAHANTYRRLINHFEPQFLLGLTATPERTDGGDILTLCDENLVYRCDLMEGIEQLLLCPFHYYGVPDDIEYQNIPWRSGKFDPDALTNAYAVEARAANAFDELTKHGGKRTLCFCCSVRHADFMAEYFRKRGLRARAVHSERSSDPRASSLAALEAGEIDVICAVDVFNEGVDIPHIDTVILLRPTESSILWLQQIGRGLRKVDDGSKPHLNIIDYIGNHRAFLVKPMTLLGAQNNGELIAALEAVKQGAFELPQGCEVTYELRAMEILEQLVATRRSRTDGLRSWYEDFKDRTGQRPRAVEAFHEGYDLRAVRDGYGSWLKFVQSQGDLSPDGAHLLTGLSGEFLTELGKTPMTKSYKMIVMQAFAHDGWTDSVSMSDLVRQFEHEAERSWVLKTELGHDLDSTTALQKCIHDNPVKAWCGRRASNGTPFFMEDADRLACQVQISERDHELFGELVWEIVDWRLADHRMKVRSRAGLGEPVSCRVTLNASGAPIIMLGRERNTDLPLGWTPIRIGMTLYDANFAKIAVNVVRKQGEETNHLGDLLRTWYGPEVGQSGRRDQVVFVRHEDEWELRPLSRSREGLQLHQPYRTEQIKQLFQGGKRKGNWMSGYVRLDLDSVLLVTLKKKDVPEHLDYEDKFLGRDHFQWESPAKTTQASEAGQEIISHVEQGREVHLFVRAEKKRQGKTVPYVYCGALALERYESEQPIRCEFRLAEPLPERLARMFINTRDERG